MLGGSAAEAGLLAAGEQRGQEHAANALAALGLQSNANQAQITGLLVSLLGSGNVTTMSKAAAALRRLVLENPGCQEEIARAGSATELITLLKRGAPDAQSTPYGPSRSP